MEVVNEKPTHKKFYKLIFMILKQVKKMFPPFPLLFKSDYFSYDYIPSADYSANIYGFDIFTYQTKHCPCTF